jgi:hypothetical protein
LISPLIQFFLTRVDGLLRPGGIGSEVLFGSSSRVVSRKVDLWSACVACKSFTSFDRFSTSRVFTIRDACSVAIFRLLSFVTVAAVRPDRMRGGRNKFGPMYKYDRAIRQQALRHRQLLISQGLLQQQDPYNDDSHQGNGLPSDVALDVKPDLSTLNCPTSFGSVSEVGLDVVRGDYGDAAVASSGRDAYNPLHCRGDAFAPPSRSARRHMGLSGVPIASPDVFPRQARPSRPHYRSQSRPYPATASNGFPFGSSATGSYDMHQAATAPLAGLASMMAEVSDFVLKPPECPSSNKQQPVIYRDAHCAPSSTACQAPYDQLSPEQQQQQMNLRNPPPQLSPSFRQQSRPPHAMVPPELPSPRAGYSQIAESKLSGSLANAGGTSTYAGTDSGASCQPNFVHMADGQVQRLHQQPVTCRSPVCYSLPPLIANLRRTEPNKQETQKKLLAAFNKEVERQKHRQSVRAAPEPSDAASTESRFQQELRAAVELVCKMCDQALFMLVEWARSAYLFRELKVGFVVVE